MEFENGALATSVENPVSHESVSDGATIREKIGAAISQLSAEGHSIRSYAAPDGWFWLIDGTRLASWLEMQGLANGFYTLADIEELY